MIKTIDTSYYIIIDTDANMFYAYYDIKHQIDCERDLSGIWWLLTRDSESEVTMKMLHEYFKENWTRFFMIKAIPIIDETAGITIEQQYDLFNKIVDAVVKYEYLCKIKI